MSNTKKVLIVLGIVVFAVAIFGIFKFFPSGKNKPVVFDFFPKIATPEDEIYIRGKNFSLEPVGVFIGGIPLKIIPLKKEMRRDELLIVKVPYTVGEGPLYIRNKYGDFKTEKPVKILPSKGTRYPKNRPYFAQSPIPPIVPVGLNQQVLIMVGVPTDINAQFTFQELEQDILDRYAVINEYYNTISKDKVSFNPTVYQAIVPLTKSHEEYIYDIRYPIARGDPISLPIDLSAYPDDSDREISIDVTDSNNVVHTISTIIPLTTDNILEWNELWWALYDVNVLVFFIETPSGDMAFDILPLEYDGDGYSITAINGNARTFLGLSSPQYFPGSGSPTDPLGFDRPTDPLWWEEIENYVENQGFDTSQYDSKNFMLIGTPTVKDDFYWIKPYGYVETHGLRATAMVGYGWMRLPHNTTWETWAHETGHNLGLWDQYQEDLDQPGQFVDGWTLMSNHWYGSHISTWEKNELGWLSSSSILSATPPGPSGAVTTSTFVMAPQYEDLPGSLPGNPDPIGYAAKIPLATNHFVILEGRQDQPEVDPRRFDEKIDEIEADDPDKKGGSVIYDIRKDLYDGTPPNVWRRQMILLSPLGDAQDPGDSYDDPATGVAVRTLDELGSGNTRSFRVAIDWGRANPPGGENFDAYITPWDSRWQSPDIWVDSPLNGWDVYESTVQTPDGDPDGAGDTIAVLEENRVYARIRNTGPEEIPNATINFWVAIPAGIGDRGDWQSLVSDTIGSIPVGGSVVANTIWIPSGTGHTCMKVEVSPIQGEINFNNNLAQENFSNFEFSSSSPYIPQEFSFLLFNPFPTKKQFSVRAKCRTKGITIKMDHSYPILEKGDKLTINGSIKIAENVQPNPRYDTDLSIAAYYSIFDSEQELGGISFHLQPRRTTQIKVKFEEYSDGLIASGEVFGGAFPRKVTFPVHLGEEISYVWDKTDNQGRFATKIPIRAKGVVEVYAYVPAKGEYSSARSKVHRFDRKK